MSSGCKFLDEIIPSSVDICRDPLKGKEEEGEDNKGNVPYHEGSYKMLVHQL